MHFLIFNYAVMMKKILFLYLFIYIVSCTNSEVQISSDFDHGSVGTMKEVEQGYFRGSTKHWMKRDNIGDQYYWFYYRIDNIKSQKMTFELENLEGVYRNKPHLIYSDHTQPVFSYDQENWERIENVLYDSASRTLKFSESFDTSPVWIAYAHPYSYQRLKSLMSSIGKNQYVSVEEIARTKEGRRIEMLTITDSGTVDDRKKTILLMAMQHAGEDAGTFYLEGLINFLLTDDADAINARKQFIYKLIPMMNPDGVFHGTTRYNSEMEDLNNIWLSEEKKQPEVAGVKRWAENWLGQGHNIDLFIDVHNHTQFYTYNVFIFNDNSMDSLRTVMNRYWPMRVWHSEPVGSSHAYFYSMGIPSGSLELSQSFAEEGDYLNISDYHHYGAETVRGLIDYFGNIQ